MTRDCHVGLAAGLLFLASCQSEHGVARWRWPIWLSFPVATVIVERVHPHLFPWTMALGVHSVPIWFQAASLGVSAVSLWLALGESPLSFAAG